ncbi:hypothetical protein LQF60_11765 [Tetragenococcus koreensis]|uniref:hypothetical protein n=1 Tax=Tetragenococcus koreensis TaxID=290335 RepID=UPI0011947492|nr:hypothetical protein [Tetragenococcus koreensis]MDN6754453.1 hypothetical protein [Enterococcus sp.]MCF1586230.1 hypothetical protein [Tetragenococcus koreensis]MCF1630490.1 hypothetical protein [Tetragenococcus koreensis]MDN6345248.1 hypothetical protein [Tetragenococcus koreensis]GEN92353.1 hypothetical protein TKO01_23990 [Tetragenococcus koreensis]
MKFQKKINNSVAWVINEQNEKVEYCGRIEPLLRSWEPANAENGASKCGNMEPLK